MNRQRENDNRIESTNIAETRRSAARFARSSRSRRRGASAVEFAIIAPVFFMLIFGMLEFGRMLMVQQVLTNAARSGSRMAVIDGATSAEVIRSVRDYLDGTTVNPADATIEVNPSNLAATDTGDPIGVRVAVNFDGVSWLPAPWFLENQTLRAESTMRRE